MPLNQTGPSSANEAKKIKIILHLGFALTGVVTTLLGAILPVLARRWQLDDAQAGYLLAAQNIGGLSSTVFVGEFIKRLGMKGSLVLSFILMLTGIAGIHVGMFSVGIAAVFGCGLGLGIAIPASNMLVADLNREHRAAALNVLNFIWCIGAVIGTPLVGYLVQKVNLYAPLSGLIIALMVIAVLLLQTKFQNQTEAQKTTDNHAPQRMSHLQNRLVLFICGFAFLLVGIENVLSGWIASYVGRLDPAQNSLASFYQAAFWASMLLGRATAPAILDRLSETRLVLIGISIAACGILLILVSLNMLVILLGVVVAGLGLSAVFPTTIAIFSQSLDAQAARQSSWLFASGSLGSSALPFFVGLVSSQFASLRIGLTLPLMAALAAIALQLNIILVVNRLKAVPK